MKNINKMIPTLLVCISAAVWLFWNLDAICETRDSFLPIPVPS